MWTDILQKNKWLIYCKKLLNISGSLKSQIAAAAAAAAGKSLQSCPTLCNPIDGSPPGSPVPGILQARTLECVAISVSNAWKWKVKVKSLSCVQLLVTPWTAAYQARLSMGFSRQEYWSGLPLPSLKRSSYSDAIWYFLDWKILKTIQCWQMRMVGAFSYHCCKELTQKVHFTQFLSL